MLTLPSLISFCTKNTSARCALREDCRCGCRRRAAPTCCRYTAARCRSPYRSPAPTSCWPDASLLVGDGEICGPSEVAKQMLGRPKLSFRGLGHDPRQLVDHVEIVVLVTCTRYITALVLAGYRHFSSLFSSFSGQFRDSSGPFRGCRRQRSAKILSRRIDSCSSPKFRTHVWC